MRIVLVVLVVVGLIAGGAAYYAKYMAPETHMGFRTVAVERGDLIDTISATGTVEPEEVVDVGAQVVGRVKDFGPDPSDPEGKKKIDYNSVVHQGTVLAYIDDSVYKAQLDQAKAADLRSQADLNQLKAKLLQTEQDWKRAKELRTIKDIPGIERPIKGIADSDYDLAVANYEMAKANVNVGEATVKQNEAALKLAQANLDYTIIKSPVEGVIIARRVNIGQTVAGGSLNTPSMFLIAKNLKKMQVWAGINEADIGRIYSHKGMPVRFTVDAFPGEVFHGKVVQVRMNANMTQNVVIYQVVVGFDNSDLRLIPYLTANLKFEVEKRENVLLVPTAALRWKPKAEQVVPRLREKLAPTLESQSGGGGPPGSSAEGAKSDKLAQNAEEHGYLWVQDGDYVRPLAVIVGATDEMHTEISGDGVKEGMQVVVGMSKGDNDAQTDETTNPFGPPRFRARRR
jgi:HlyD family secretion protein